MSRTMVSISSRELKTGSGIFIAGDSKVQHQNRSRGACPRCLAARNFVRRKVDRALRRMMVNRRGFAAIILHRAAERSIHHARKYRRAGFRLGENAELRAGLSMGKELR